MAPLVILALVSIPGPFWIRGVSALAGITMGLVYSLGYLFETAEHRLVKTGYPVVTGERGGEQHQTQSRSAAVAQRRKNVFDRLERRGRR